MHLLLYQSHIPLLHTEVLWMHHCTILIQYCTTVCNPIYMLAESDPTYTINFHFIYKTLMLFRFNPMPWHFVLFSFKHSIFGERRTKLAELFHTFDHSFVRSMLYGYLKPICAANMFVCLPFPSLYTLTFPFILNVDPVCSMSEWIIIFFSLYTIYYNILLVSPSFSTPASLSPFLSLPPSFHFRYFLQFQI